MFKILIFLISALFIENIQSLNNFTKCYHFYCYFWNGKAIHYYLLEPCPDGYWTLEIYNDEVQKEVDEFISLLIPNTPSIKSYCVPLNIKCLSRYNCIWNKSIKKAQYFNWGTSDATPGTGVYYFQASNTGNKWLHMDSLYHYCGKVCMTDVQGTGAGTDSVKGTDLGMKFYIILLLTSLVITLIILGIIIYFALKKKKSIRTDVKSFDTPPELDVEAMDDVYEAVQNP